ncbi:MAG: hypothetical protein VM34scaffold347_21 [Phage 66_12]|jgi:hypothetical protein|nr:MAG: hypothetical protein VM34scaffold347_21 [Phage 66_12]
MPMWNDLDRALEGSGLTVKVGYAGWKSYGHGTPSKAESVGCHHTAGPPKGDTPSLNTVIYGRSDLPGPLCNLYLSRSGEVYLVAAGIGYHAGATLEPWQDNNSGIGIEAEATGVDPWPAHQYDVYARMCSHLAAYYHIPVGHVMGHKEICDPPGRKIDPNFGMDSFRDAVLKGGTVPVAPPAPTDFPDEEENAMLLLFSTDQLTDPEPGDPDADPPVPSKPATFRHGFHGQRSAEAGGGSQVAADAWAVFSTAWGGCHVSIAELNGAGGVHFLLGKPGEPVYVENNRAIPLHLGQGTRMVTVEGWRDSEGTVPSCDVYNLR